MKNKEEVKKLNRKVFSFAFVKGIETLSCVLLVILLLYYGSMANLIIALIFLLLTIYTTYRDKEFFLDFFFLIKGCFIRRKIIKKGKKITAVVSEYKIREEKRSYLSVEYAYIICTYKDSTGKKHTFKSEFFDKNIKSLYKKKSKIDVYVDENYKNYYVDVQLNC